MHRTLAVPHQPATSTAGRRARPPLPDRPPLRPAAYLAAIEPTVVVEPRRVGAFAGAGALTVMLSTVIAIAFAAALGGVWLLLVKLAG